MNSIAQKDGKAYKALRGVLKAYDLNQLELCKPTGLSCSTVDAYMAGRKSWTVEQAYKILAYLDLPDSAISQYFPANPWVAVERRAASC